MLKFAKSTLTIWIAMLLVLLSAGINAHLMRTDAAGEALWTTKEAYFFIFRDRVGWRVKWIGYPLIVAGEMFGRIEPPDDGRGTMYAIRVTSSGVERHVLDLTDRRPGSGPGAFTPIGDRIWANFPAIGGLCWWAGDHFERATEEESRGLGGIENFYHLDNRAYLDESGWSKEWVGAEQNIVINLGDGTEISAYGSARNVPLLIEMRRRAGEPRTVLSVETGAGLVSSKEYRRAFSGQPPPG